MGIQGSSLSTTAARDEEAAASLGIARSTFSMLRARLRASPWHPLVARAGLLVIALAVLAWIGRAATAATPASASAEVGPLAASASLPTSGGAPAAPAEPARAAPAESVPARVETAPPCAPAAASEGPSRATPNDPVYLNHASAEELRRLPGAGPKRALSIVALRQRMGRFQRVEDLLRVKGIGRSTLRKWRPLVRLDAPPRVVADAGAPE